MRYLDVLWRHASPAEPVRLVSEIDEAGRELRKLEFFVDGRVGYAFESREAGGTCLSLEPLPSLAQINAQGQFDGMEIEALTFEELWRQHVGGAT